MLIISRARALAFAVLLIPLCCSASASQTASPVDKGTPGIDVTLESIAGGKRMETKTDENGRFSFSNVVAGIYKLRIGCVGVRSSEPAGSASSGSRDDERCRAEMRIVVTDGSKGDISGFVGKSN
jgi:hypothetical protein